MRNRFEIPLTAVFIFIVTACSPDFQLSLVSLNSLDPKEQTENINDSSLLENELEHLNDDEVVDWLILAWQGGTDFDTTHQALLNTGWIPSENVVSFFPNLKNSPFFEVALTDQSKPEWVISLLYDDHRFCRWGLPCSGRLVIIGEGGIIFELTSDLSKGWNFPIATGNFDLNGDDLHDIVATSYRVNGVFDLLTSIHILSSYHGEVRNIISQDNQGFSSTNACIPALIHNDDWNTPGMFIYEGQLEINHEELRHPPQIVYSGVTVYDPDSEDWACPQKEFWGWNGSSIVLTKVENPKEGNR